MTRICTLSLHYALLTSLTGRFAEEGYAFFCLVNLMEGAWNLHSRAPSLLSIKTIIMLLPKRSGWSRVRDVNFGLHSFRK